MQLILTLSILTQPSNASIPISKEVLKLIDFKLKQFSKALSPILGPFTSLRKLILLILDELKQLSPSRIIEVTITSSTVILKEKAYLANIVVRLETLMISKVLLLGYLSNTVLSALYSTPSKVFNLL